MNIYVSADTWRSGDGSKERPFQRITEGALIAKPGDTVLVQPGVYREAVCLMRGGTADARISFRSVVAGGAIVTGADDSADEEGTGVNERPVRSHCFYTKGRGVDYITLSGFVLKQCGGDSEETAAVSCTGASGWIIEDCEIADTDGEGIHFEGLPLLPYPMVNGDDRRMIQKQLLFASAAGDTASGACNSHIVRRCNIHDCKSGGITAQRATAYSVIEDNHIHHLPEADAVILHGTADVTIRRNRIDHVAGGVRLIYETQNIRISQNVFHDNGTEGSVEEMADIVMRGSHGPVFIDNNLLLSKGSFITDTAGAALAHNLICGALSAEHMRGESVFFYPHTTVPAGFSEGLPGKLVLYGNLFAPASRTDNTAPVVFPCLAKGNLYYNGMQAGRGEENALTDTEHTVNLQIEETAQGQLLLSGNLSEVMQRHRIEAASGGEILGAHALGLMYFPDLGEEPLFTEDYHGVHRAPAPLAGPFEKLNPKFVVFDMASTGEQVLREAARETEEKDKASSFRCGIALLGVEDITVKIDGRDFHPQEIFVLGNTAWIHGRGEESLTETDCVFGVAKTIQKWTMEADDSFDAAKNEGIHKLAECVTLLMCMLNEGRRVNGQSLSASATEETAPYLREYGISMRLTPDYLKFIRSGEKKFLTLEETVRCVAGRSMNFIAEVVEEK